MEFKLRFFRSDVFAKVFLPIPPGLILNGLIFTYKDKRYKIQEIIIEAFDKMPVWNAGEDNPCPALIVQEVVVEL